MMINKKIFSIIILLTLIFPLISANEGIVTGEESSSEYLDFCHTEAECIKYLEEQGMPEDFLKEEGIEIICTDGYCESVKIVKEETREGVKIVANAIVDCTEGHKWCGYENGSSVIKECVDGKEETIEQCDDSCDYNDNAEPICENSECSLQGSENSGNSLYYSKNSRDSLLKSTNSGNSLYYSKNSGWSLLKSTNSGNSLYYSKNSGWSLQGSENSGCSLENSVRIE